MSLVTEAHETYYQQLLVVYPSHFIRHYYPDDKINKDFCHFWDLRQEIEQIDIRLSKLKIQRS